MSKVDAITATTVTAATTAPAASRLDASTCHETGCKYMPRDRMQMHAARLDATTSAGDWGQVLCMRVRGRVAVTFEVAVVVVVDAVFRHPLQASYISVGRTSMASIGYKRMQHGPDTRDQRNRRRQTRDETKEATTPGAKKCDNLSPLRVPPRNVTICRPSRPAMNSSSQGVSPRAAGGPGNVTICRPSCPAKKCDNLSPFVSRQEM